MLIFYRENIFLCSSLLLSHGADKKLFVTHNSFSSCNLKKKKKHMKMDIFMNCTYLVFSENPTHRYANIT